MSVPVGSPLNYVLGSQPPIKRVSETVAPTSNNYKNFREGDEWLNTTTSTWYKLSDITQGVATWTQLAAGAGELNTITTPDTTIVMPTAGNIDFANGSGMAITGSGNTITFAATAPPSIITWTVITSATKTIVSDEGYFANRGAGVVFTLPATSSVGDIFYITGINAGGWSITQNAGQDVRMGAAITTTGGGGSLASTSIGDSIFAVCSVANTSWVVFSSMGNITIV